MKKEKINLIKLEKPSAFKRLWKLYLYNIIVSTVVYFGFFGFWTLDDVAFELDWFFFYTVFDFRWQLIPCVLSFVLMVRQSFKLINLFYYTHLMLKHDVEVVVDGGYKRVYDGKEGIGKTLNMTYNGLLIACDKDESMRLRYFLQYPFREQLKDDTDFKVLKESFEYYQNNPKKIPHFMANFEVEYNGQKQYEFDMGYLDQSKRLAESFSLCLTEIGNILPNRESRISKDPEKDVNNMIEKNETFSQSRQWFDLTICSDEQRSGEIFLGFRSVSSGSTLVARRKVLAPKFLEFILNRRYAKIMRKELSTSKRLAKRYLRLNDIIQDLGFYVFDEIPKNVENSKDLGIIQSFAISCDLPFTYDTRNERKRYKLYDKEPDFEVSKKEENTKEKKE